MYRETATVLKSHAAIGWDIDQTLISGPHSDFFRNWVANNYQNHLMHVITFRYGKDFDNAVGDLEAAGYDIEWFSGVHGIPAEYANEYYKTDRMFESFNPLAPTERQLRQLERTGMTLEQVLRERQQVRMWKARKCKELGLTLLVDDADNMVVDGCQVYDVKFLHALFLNYFETFDAVA